MGCVYPNRVAASAAEVPGGGDTGHCQEPPGGILPDFAAVSVSGPQPWLHVGLVVGAFEKQESLGHPGSTGSASRVAGLRRRGGTQRTRSLIGRCECTGGWCKVGTRGGPITSPRIWRDAHLVRGGPWLPPHPRPGCPVKREGKVKGRAERKAKGGRRHMSARSLHGTHSREAWQALCPRRALKERDLGSTL